MACLKVAPHLQRWFAASRGREAWAPELCNVQHPESHTEAWLLLGCHEGPASCVPSLPPPLETITPGFKSLQIQFSSGSVEAKTSMPSTSESITLIHPSGSETRTFSPELSLLDKPCLVKQKSSVNFFFFFCQ